MMRICMRRCCSSVFRGEPIENVRGDVLADGLLPAAASSGACESNAAAAVSVAAAGEETEAAELENALLGDAAIASPLTEFATNIQ